ncbi:MULTISPECIES: hypothetical protein [Streptomyces]|uniref:hypothetical protein n=1 Tax=Streptomyces TaxID=1883 RepID=UPI00123CC0C5|nr:hypothetical protein [Streptomyces galilaeus]
MTLKYTPLRSSTTLQRFAFLVAMLTAATALSGCSNNEKKKYAPPESLCGVSVEPDLLAPFLPPGKRISTQLTRPNDGTQRCTVSVDDQLALIAGQIWWYKTGTVEEIASVHARVNNGNVTTGNNFLYSGTGAVGKVDGCTNSTHPDKALFTTVQVFTSGQEDASTMGQLITRYTEHVRAGRDCE